MLRRAPADSVLELGPWDQSHDVQQSLSFKSMCVELGGNDSRPPKTAKNCSKSPNLDFLKIDVIARISFVESSNIDRLRPTIAHFVGQSQGIQQKNLQPNPST